MLRPTGIDGVRISWSQVFIPTASTLSSYEYNKLSLPSHRNVVNTTGPIHFTARTTTVGLQRRMYCTPGDTDFETEDASKGRDIKAVCGILRNLGVIAHVSATGIAQDLGGAIKGGVDSIQIPQAGSRMTSGGVICTTWTCNWLSNYQGVKRVSNLLVGWCLALRCGSSVRLQLPDYLQSRVCMQRNMCAEWVGECTLASFTVVLLHVIIQCARVITWLCSENALNISSRVHVQCSGDTGGSMDTLKRYGYPVKYWADTSTWISHDQPRPGRKKEKKNSHDMTDREPAQNLIMRKDPCNADHVISLGFLKYMLLAPICWK